MYITIYKSGVCNGVIISQQFDELLRLFIQGDEHHMEYLAGITTHLNAATINVIVWCNNTCIDFTSKMQ